MNFQAASSDIKRSDRENLNTNSNQSLQAFIEKEPINFNIKPQATFVVNEIAATESRHVVKVTNKKQLPPPPPKPVNNTKMKLPLQRIKTNTTEVIIDSEPNSPKKYEYDLDPKKVQIMIEKTIERIEPKKQLTRQDIQPWIDASLQKLPKGITKEDVQPWIESSLQKLPKPMTKYDVQPLIDESIKKQPNPMTKDDVQPLIDESIKKQPKPMTKDDVQPLIDESIKKQPKGITKEDVQHWIDDTVEKEKLSHEHVKPWIDSSIEEKHLISQKEMESCIQSTLKNQPDPQNIVENYVNAKLEAIPDKSMIEPLVEKYLAQMIKEESNKSEDLKSEEDNEDEALTKFEEMIEPAVARIVKRIMKYDLDHSEADIKSLNLDINYDEVYDYEMQEKGQFEAPSVETRPQLPGMYNPMYINNDNLKDESDQVVEMGSVYKAEDSKVFYENELRSEFKSSRKWIRFGNGIEKGNVIDMILDKSHKKIYIVGHFKHVNRVPIDNIAVYDMKEKSWNHVGNGIPTVATCVAVHEESQIVFIGGVFSKVGKGDSQVFAHNIAAYYVLQNRWVPLGSGLNRDCNALVLDEKNEKLYAGGTFTQSGEDPMHYVGIYDIASNTWTNLYGGEVNGPCRTLMKTNETDLYIGGLFTHAGHSDIHASYVAKYDLGNNTWSDLSGGLQGYCNALAFDASENVVYVGGTFNSVGMRESAEDAHHVAKYYIDYQKWDTMNEGVNNVVNSLCFDDYNQCLYVGGNFTHTFDGDIILNRIAKYIPYTNTWCSLDNHFPNCKVPNDDEGNDNVGLNGVCKVMNMDDKSLFVAGNFQIAGSITANSIVRYVVNRGGTQSSKPLESEN